MSENNKQCIHCKDIKPLEDFVLDRRSPSRRSGICKRCEAKRVRQCYNPEKQRLRLLKQRYGLTKDAHKEMLKQCNNKCEICRKAAKLHVDHDHKTGKIRGLLCDKCNRGLGHFDDDVAIFIRATTYLRRAS